MDFWSFSTCDKIYFWRCFIRSNKLRFTDLTFNDTKSLEIVLKLSIVEKYFPPFENYQRRRHKLFVYKISTNSSQNALQVLREKMSIELRLDKWKGVDVSVPNRWQAKIKVVE